MSNTRIYIENLKHTHTESAVADFGVAPYPSQLAKPPKGEPGELATEEPIFAMAQEELSFAVAKGY